MGCVFAHEFDIWLNGVPKVTRYTVRGARDEAETWQIFTWDLDNYSYISHEKGVCVLVCSSSTIHCNTVLLEEDNVLPTGINWKHNKTRDIVESDGYMKTLPREHVHCELMMEGPDQWKQLNTTQVMRY